jgi:hypothetical protein
MELLYQGMKLNTVMVSSLSLLRVESAIPKKLRFHSPELKTLFLGLVLHIATLTAREMAVHGHLRTQHLPGELLLPVHAVPAMLLLVTAIIKPLWRWLPAVTPSIWVVHTKA